MNKIILLKGDNPNKGIRFSIEEKPEIVLSGALENPVSFLGEHGALGFTRSWTTREVDLLGGNDKDIYNQQLLQ